MLSIDDCEIESRKTYQMKLLGFDFAKLIISLHKFQSSKDLLQVARFVH